MNILVPIKQVPDTGMNLQVKNGDIDESALKWVLGPYDEFALEESLKLKEKLGGQVFVLTLGPEKAKEALLTALALGADEAFHLLMAKLPEDPLATAQILKDEISKIPDLSLIFCGKLSTDSNNFAIPQMLAQLLDLPFVSNINKLKFQDGLFILDRESSNGVDEILKAKTPLLLSADKGLNRPRYPSLPGIMKAKKKALHVKKVIGKEERIKRVQLRLPPEKKPPQILTGDSEKQVAELVRILKDKERLL